MIKPKKIVLVESSFFEYITEENEAPTWKPLKMESLPFIPIIVTTEAIKSNNRITYTLSYELPYTHESIMTSSIETFIVEKGEDGTTHSTLIKLPNNEYGNNLEATIRLNNQNIDMTKKMLEGNDVAYEYILKKKRHIFSLVQLLDKSSSYLLDMQKKLKK